MSEAPKAKEVDPTEWGTYWKNEIKMLKIRKGINQLEKLDKNEVPVLIGEMVLECQKPPYNQISKVIIQRVISDAVLNDPEFYNFNVAWVRKTLNKWWHLSGWKLVEKMQREKEVQEERKKEVPAVNPHEDIHQTVSNYVKSLLKDAREKKDGMRKVPDLSPEQIQINGKERLVEKADSAIYSIDHVKNYQINLQHEIHHVTNEGYAHVKPIDKINFKLFVVEGIYKVICASMQHAEEIYREAKNRLDARIAKGEKV